MKINKEINYQIEAIDYIQLRYSEVDIIKDIKEKLIDRGISVEKIDSLLEKQKVFLDAIKKEVNVSKELIPYFLVEFEYNQSFLKYFYIEYMSSKKSDYQSFLNLFFKQHILEERTTKFQLDITSVLKHINGLKIDDTRKLTLINFYLGGFNLFNKLLFEIEEVAKIIKDNINYIIKDILVAHQLLLEEPNLINYVNEYLNIDKILKGDEEVTLLGVSCNQLSLSLIDNKMHIYVGYLGMKINEIKKDSSLNEKRLINILKTISDPTRFKILQILKSGTTFGNDIAKRVELTPATVNHHLNILVNEHLLKVEFSDSDNKKVYYRLQEHIIKQLVDNLRRSLL